MEPSEIISCIHAARIRHIPPVDTFDYGTYKEFLLEAICSNKEPHVLRFFKQGKYYKKVSSEVDLIDVAIKSETSSRILRVLLEDLSLPLSEKACENLTKTTKVLIENGARLGWSRMHLTNLEIISQFFNDDMLIDLLRKAYKEIDLRTVKFLLGLIEKSNITEIPDSFADITTRREQAKCLQSILQCTKFNVMKRTKELLEVAIKLKSRALQFLVLKHFFLRYHPRLGIHEVFLSKIVE